MNRQEKLESRKFAMHFGDRMRDELSDEHAAMLAYYIENRDDAEVGRLLREIFRPHIKEVLEFMEETDPEPRPARGDIEAFKEHRDLNPELYK